MDISKIQIPGGRVLDIKDAEARQSIEVLSQNVKVVPEDEISTIHIDESNSTTSSKVVITGDIAVNKNSAGVITGVKPASTNVISWIKENSKLLIGVYNTTLKAMIVKDYESDWQDNNPEASQYMRLPRFWYKCTDTSDGCDISFTHNENAAYHDDWNEWDGNTLIATYKATLIGDNKSTFKNSEEHNTDGVALVSHYDTKPSTWFSWDECRKITRNMGDGFGMVTYEAHKMMEILFYAYYGEVDSQLICGTGAAVSSWDINNHLNGRVMDQVYSLSDTVASDNPTCNHFWGLCDWWGNVYELIDNIKTFAYNDSIQIPGAHNDEDSSNVPLAIYNYDGSINRIINDTAYVEGTTLGKKWGRYADTVPTIGNENYDEVSGGGYAVVGCVGEDPGSVAMRSSHYVSEGGVGFLYLCVGPDARDSRRGSRLQYHGSISYDDELDPFIAPTFDGISTIHIDESNSDGYNKVKITRDHNGAIKWIKNNSKLYVGRYDTDLKILKVAPLDKISSISPDWNTSTTDNQFMKLPQFWYKCVKTPVGCDISFAYDENLTDSSWNEWDGNTFIGCYKASFAGNATNIATFKNGGAQNTDGVVLTSHYNTKPSTWFSWEKGKEITRNMGEGFSLVTYDSHKIMEILFYAYYTEVDAQKACGKGSTVSSWDGNSHLNGRTMTQITSFMDTISSTGTTNVKFWGLEDWWGNVYEWIDDLYTVGYNNDVQIPDAYDGDATQVSVAVLNYDGTINRVMHDTCYQDSLTLRKRWGKYADTIPVKCTDEYDDYSDGGYTVYGCVGDDFGFVARRSYGSDSSDGGVGFLYLVNYAVGRSSDCGSRLQYHGNWAEVSSF